MAAKSEKEKKKANSALFVIMQSEMSLHRKNSQCGVQD